MLIMTNHKFNVVQSLKIIITQSMQFHGNICDIITSEKKVGLKNIQPGNKIKQFEKMLGEDISNITVIVSHKALFENERFLQLRSHWVHSAGYNMKGIKYHGAKVYQTVFLISRKLICYQLDPISNLPLNILTKTFKGTET